MESIRNLTESFEMKHVVFPVLFPVRVLKCVWELQTTSSVLISNLPSNNSSLKSVLVLFRHHTTNTRSRNICSCQTSPQSDLSRLPPGCSPKPHSSDGLHLPIPGNHLQPSKSSKETLTAHWCNRASHSHSGAAQHGQETTKNILSDPFFCWILQSCLCSIYVSDKRPKEINWRVSL